MNKPPTAMDRRFRLIVLFIALGLLACVEFMHAQQLAKPSRFSSNTLRIGVESFLRDRLEETDEFEIAREIPDQAFAESFVVARCDASVESLSGSTKVQIVFSKNDNVIRRIYVPVRINLKRSVPVATRLLPRGDVVQSTDVEYRLSDVTYLQAKLPDDVIGKRLTATVGKGAVITQAHLGSAAAIQRGDIVNIVLRNGAVSVRASGAALDDAASGQSVRVRRDDSQVIISGIVGDEKTVYVSIPQLSPSSSLK